MADPLPASSAGETRRYNERCNGHQFDQLGDFVAVDVEVNGEVQGLSAYVAGLEAVVRAGRARRTDPHVTTPEPNLRAPQDPGRIVTALRAYLTAFFDQHLGGRHRPLLDGPSPKHPDITFVS